MHRYTATLANEPASTACTWTGEARHVYDAAKEAMAYAYARMLLGPSVDTETRPRQWIVAYAETPDKPIATITVAWVPGQGWQAASKGLIAALSIRDANP